MNINLNLNTKVPSFKAQEDWEVSELFDTWRNNIAKSGDRASLNKFDELRYDIKWKNFYAELTRGFPDTVKIERNIIGIFGGDIFHVENAKPTLPIDKIFKKMNEIKYKL